MVWFFENAKTAFRKHRSNWDAINRIQGDHPLLDSGFVESLIGHFASAGTLLGISDDGKNPGMAVLEGTRPGFWQTFQPSQAPLGLIVLGNRNHAELQMAELIRCIPGFCLGFSVTQQDPDFTVFNNIGESHRIEKVEYIQTGRLTLNGSFEDYWNSRETDLVNNLARRCRRLSKEGIQFELIIDREASCVAERIKEYGELENLGWKAVEGTAVMAENEQGHFYREALEKFCTQGEGIVFRLLFNGKVVASQLGVVRDGMVVLLKTAYDEKLRHHSPGFLLQREIFQALYSQGDVKVVEFYGRVREGWTRKWTDEIRPLYHYNFYRNGAVASTRGLYKLFCHFSKAGTVR